MQIPTDRIRYQLLRARELDPGMERDERIVAALTDALIEARRSSDATEGVMRSRFGFTEHELSQYGRAAKDTATQRWIQLNAVEAA